MDTVLRIDAHSGEHTQISVPFPADLPPGTLRITGPARAAADPGKTTARPPLTHPATWQAIGRAPDGSVWLSQLGSSAALVRIEPDNCGRNTRSLYEARA